MESGKKQRLTLTLDPRSIQLIEVYAKELHLSRSAFVDLMVTQIDQVLRVGLGVPEYLEEEKRDAGHTGEN